MLALHRRTIPAAVLTLALGWGIAGCSSDEGGTSPGVNPAVIGTWNATSFVAQGTDLITQGMGFSIVFNSNGTYSFNITNDQSGLVVSLEPLCDGGAPDCSYTGSFTATGSQIVLDPGTIDQETLNYSISGTTMTFTATLDLTPITVVLDRI